MTPVTDAARVQFPAGPEPYPYQAEMEAAWRQGARRTVLLWHRQSGKGLTALRRTAVGAFERPGTYAIVSPTSGLALENFWDARNPDTGAPYLDVIPPALLLDKNENEKALVMATRVAGKTSRIVFRSADDPDRLRGPAYAGVVLDEFATMPSAEPLDIVRIPLDRAKGWLLIGSTPKGMNHLYDVWKNAEAAGGWYLSKKTIEDTRKHDGTPIIRLEDVEQERREGQREEWIHQEYYCEFSAALASSYYAAELTRAEAEGRILDLPHHSELPVVTGWDLGIRDATAIIYAQHVGPYVHLIDAEQFEALSLPEILSRVRARPYLVQTFIAPHDIEVRDYTAGVSRREVAAGLGVHFDVAPRLPVQEGIDAVRRLFGRLRFDRRRCAPLLEALAGYAKVWDERAKIFKDKPGHSKHSHYADALRTFATGDAGPVPLVAREIQVESTWDLRSFARSAEGPGGPSW